ncbi:unnamed protein product [Penicillium salamii]|uniref:Zn(2)-C6 fungal-type domain-containing protein n=1 Tax=Penicillium salamii TaxID=1612424 RepID=A0A9W4JD13_9EURO|nr:unnamed protein product [Penicillium salamii]
MSGRFPLPECPDNNTDNNTTDDWVPGYPQPSDFPSLEPRTDRVNAKVAIPRNAPSSNLTASGRVSRACENCREQKAKCSGHRPVCHRCQDAGVQCSYGDRKKEKTVKQLNDLSIKVGSLQALLRDIYHTLDASSAHQVDQCLGDLNLSTPLLPTSTLAIPQPLLSDVIASPMVTPPGVVDYTEEDFNRDEKTQAMGFVGDYSEIAWLYRLKRDLDHDTPLPTKEPPESPAMSSVNYFQDDAEIPVHNNLDLARRPPQHIADRLVEDYFHAVHPLFPILGKAIFLNQYRSFYSNPSRRPGRRWLAVMNMVFAIATKYGLLTNKPQADHGDHSEFFARAWKLGGSGSNVLLDHPNLQQTQVEGLAAFYLLAIGQVNRSWRFVGIAIRSAMAMGLNLRSETDSITHSSRELRYRVWWALLLLDTVLCEITGRPPSTGHAFCTTPLPIPFLEEDIEDERVVQLVSSPGARSAFLSSLLSDAPALIPKESPGQLRNREKQKQPGEKSGQLGFEILTPNASLYFLYAVDLAHLLQRAVAAIYVPGLARQSWYEVEAAISTFNGHVDNWLSRLPVQFQHISSYPAQEFLNQRVGLACRFYAAKMIILQPCIRRLAQMSSEASTPGTVCDNLAAICVQAAGQMIDLLPEIGNTDWLYGVAPWWCILHNIMQATSILLTELLTRAIPHTAQASNMAAKLKKAIEWLHAMSAKDEASRCAWVICAEILSRHGSKFELDFV